MKHIAFIQTLLYAATQANHARCQTDLYENSPAISALSPPAVAKDSTDFQLTIRGNNFLDTSFVLFDGEHLDPSDVTVTTLTVTVPAHLLTTEHFATVQVVTGTSGGPVPSAVKTFSVGGIGGLTALVPSETTINPELDLRLRITGDNFRVLNDTGVWLNPRMLESE